MENGKIPEDLKAFVKEVGSKVTPDELDTYKAINDVQNTNQKYEVILTAWEAQHREERNLRRNFAIAIFVTLLVQILAINTTFFLIGFKVMQVEPWVANTFIIAVFTEIVSMTLIVLRYLFPKASKELMELVQKL